MLAILNSLNAHNFPIFEPILMILESKFMIHGVLSDTVPFKWSTCFRTSNGCSHI